MNKYVAISAFVYSMDFARWLMSLSPPESTRFLAEFPSPSLAASREACSFVCSQANLEGVFIQHGYTTEREAGGRCFDVCYVSVVMELLLGENAGEGVVYYIAEVRPIIFHDHVSRS